MNIEQIYTGCLAQGAYFIESDGEAVVIDPLREVQPYLQKAKNTNARIKYIFETHFHADFVSGHIDLARETGATIVYGPNATTSFPSHIAADGEIFSVGKISFQLIHTPGHTLESSCFLLKDKCGKNIALFTGDTLFIGDVGRPDIAQNKASEITQDFLASLLYDSLHNKILPLEDEIIVYPAHGAGSACGKNMSKETSDSLGHQKQTNYALRTSLSKEEFVHQLTTGLKPPPAYFPLNVKMNRNGYDSIREVLERGTKALSLADFEDKFNKDALLIDTRHAQTFAKGFIPGSINIGLNGSFAPWVGTLVPFKKQNLLLITDDGREEETVTRLARIGYDSAIGYLKGGFSTWYEAGKSIDKIQSISTTQLAKDYVNCSISIVDVRNETEYHSSHVSNVLHIPLDTINEKLTALDKNKSYYVHCAGGYRSMIFISIFKARGYDKLIDVKGGFNEMKSHSEFKLTGTLN